MTLNQGIKHLDYLLDRNKFSCNTCRKEHEQLKKWLLELQKLRKLNNKRKWRSYKITYWCNSPDIAHELNILARSSDEAIRKYRKMFPKMHPLTASLNEQ